MDIFTGQIINDATEPGVPKHDLKLAFELITAASIAEQKLIKEFGGKEDRRR